METKTGEVVKVKPNSAPKAIPALTPAQMLSTLVTQGAAPEVLSKFMDLQDRWEATESKKSYVRAMAAFKSEAIVIIKNKNVNYTKRNNDVVDYDHESLDHVLDIVVPYLSKHGFSHKWVITEPNDKIHVACVITHKAGHSESTGFSGEPDESGGKNPIQAKASTIKYIERYTFLAITGLAARGQDDDGRKSTPEPEKAKLISKAQIARINKIITNNKCLDRAKFLTHIKKDSVEEIPALSFKWVIEQLEKSIKNHAVKTQK